jgi:AcrR family transcriptional regulator
MLPPPVVPQSGALAGDSTGVPQPCGRGAPRERAICDAALDLLVEVGYDRMSMDAVAARARASKATIYRHWPGKRELVLAAISWRAQRSGAEPGYAPPDTGSLRGDLHATFRALADGIGGEDVALVSGVLRAMQAAPELAECMRHQLVDAKRDITRLVVDRAVARGELPAETDADLLHEVAPALLFWQLLILGQPADDAYVTHVIDDVVIPLLSNTRTDNPIDPIREAHVSA